MALDFEKGGGLLPAVIQDAKTGKVLMLGYMNEESLAQTRETGKVTFFSRSKNRLWVKGETSSNFLIVKEILEDCDGDTLLIKADPQGPVCHTGSDTCFDEVNKNEVEFLNHLTAIIEDRKNNPSDASYTASLFKKGTNKVAQKVGEEAVEVVIEAKDDNDDLFLNESADLLFHLMVLLSHKGFSLDDVVKILKSRHQTS
ncbi:bifunctional phosphoribosyl-AMP cyclohydrolase/phosphoribosyl-ATP diphosphatase HisIE [Marinoscillum furvescens]|uniref:Histidine biosynthesis bifunctional protein HisIE n=1 Tax=Marinoscillum furvescens DSM 4134 TaxID=1122208 RepID=A0A3D9L3B5_MARFU|nr:bifunctional phosphoribosyl-AMP cyclohydrolase/phosphoribosyl-ATP diphosphatase HisIE [Marinoscillum furvescens]RED97471.1 phosphoribosyl-ATP pyrophosphatase /phosphoribosyl-AMP cyclohydrolase [Marinoscillum furvescens DSM 4134]